jgi:hypothetical protein
MRPLANFKLGWSYHIAQQPSVPYCCEPRRKIMLLMGRQFTEPSKLPMFPPVAPKSFEAAPLASGLLKSPAVCAAPPRPWGTTEPP